MILKPFQKTPKIPRVALVNDEGQYIDESGSVFYDNSDYKFRLGEIVCYILWDTAVYLTKKGQGEILRWNGSEIRWRGTKHIDEDYWKPRVFDAGILKFPVTTETDFNTLLKELVEFRDWICSEGARPYCSLGSTSISLLKAKLDKEFVTGRGSEPPIEFTRGGRTVMGKEGMGTYEGQIYNWDLPAAYASSLGNICYDGIWAIRPYNSAIKAYGHGAPVYCHAIVDIPNLPFGPLPDYLSRPDNPIERAFRNALGFPTEEKVEGVWILNELEAAEETGCKITPITCWVNMTGRQPFLPWWNAILHGRSLEGRLARFLAKRTGNALWGMFASDQKANSSKVIIHFENGEQKNRRIDFRVNGQKPGHDLAEAISGTVRAKLYQHIVAANTHLLSAHTDGLWVEGNYEKPDGWRIKTEAKRIDLIDPQTFRYHTSNRNSYVVMSGIPPKIAPEKFQQRWDRIQNRSRDNNVQKVRKGRFNKGRV
jgi:hypothetical protein